MRSPVLSVHDFSKQFKLVVDAGDVGIGAALFPEHSDNVDRTVSYFSKKLISMFI